MIHNSIMSDNPLEPLRGKALLEKLQTLSNLPHGDRAIAVWLLHQCANERWATENQAEFIRVL